MRTRRLVMILAVVAMVMGVMAPASAGDPKCSGFDFGGSMDSGWANHANHIIEQYILGLGLDTVDWNPSDDLDGGQVDSATVVAFAGTAGKGHLAAGDPPGASFC